MRAGALADAVEDERLLVLSIALAEGADLAAARRALEGRTIARARQVLDDPDLAVHPKLQPAARTATRVLT